MSNEPQEVIGVKAIREVLGIGRVTFQNWLAEASQTDDPMPVYRMGSAQQSTYYAYADELRAWKRRRPIWRPKHDQQSPPPRLDNSGRGSTITFLHKQGE